MERAPDAMSQHSPAWARWQEGQTGGWGLRRPPLMFWGWHASRAQVGWQRVQWQANTSAISASAMTHEAHSPDLQK